jgi:hypothetical protein
MSMLEQRTPQTNAPILVHHDEPDSSSFFAEQNPATNYCKGSAGISPHSFNNIPLYKTAPVVQTKLTVNAPGDQYEQEADAMAGKVRTLVKSNMYTMYRGNY